MSKLYNSIVVAAMTAGWVGSASVAHARDSLSLSWDAISPQGGWGGQIKGSGPYVVTGSPVGTGSKVELTDANTGVATTISPLLIFTDPGTGQQTFGSNKTGLPPDPYGIKITVSYKDRNGIQQLDATLIGAATARP